MRHPYLATPGASANRTAVIVAGHTTPRYPYAPLDGAPAPAAAPAAGGAPAGGADGGGQAPPTTDSGTGAAGGQPGGTPAPPQPLGGSPDVLFRPPDPAPVVVTPPPNAPGGPGTASPPPAKGRNKPADRSLDEFDPDIRDYIASLRREAGDGRVKAKTADERAQEAAQAQVKTWLDGFAKVLGVAGDDGGQPGQPEVTPEQRAEQLSTQLAQRDADHRAALVELAVWKAAAVHDAHPGRLTDSRTFMRGVEGLDPTADDFASKVAAAIGAAVKTSDHFKVAPPAGPAPVPVPPPPVPSGGDFAGGPSGGSNTDPQSVDDFRAELRKRRERGPAT